MIDERLLAILACPRCDARPPLELTDNQLICTKCHAQYSIVDGIPNLLPEDATFEGEDKESSVESSA